jgi:hypothetical protein
MPATTRANPIKIAPRKNITPHVRHRVANIIAVAKAKKKAAWPEGKEPEVSLKISWWTALFTKGLG